MASSRAASAGVVRRVVVGENPGLTSTGVVSRRGAIL